MYVCVNNIKRPTKFGDHSSELPYSQLSLSTHIVARASLARLLRRWNTIRKEEKLLYANGAV